MQAFEGVCIARRNRGVNSSFTVRKISYGEGVERVFPLYSPRIDSIEVVRRGRVRRAKLYYLRGRTGKAARITERRDDASGARAGGGKTYGSRRPLEQGAGRMASQRTLFEKIWDSHVVEQRAGRHLPALHRPPPRPRGDQPAGLRGAALAGRKVRRPDATLAVPDHNVPTSDRSKGIADETSRIQVETLDAELRRSSACRCSA